MNVYDKAIWHIEGGEDENEVLERFKAVFEFLFENNMLNEDGKDIFECCVDETVSLNSDLLTEEGNNFLDSCYDDVLNRDPKEIKKNLQEEYKKIQEDK